MQSLALPPSSFVTPEFGHPRFSSGPERFSLSLPRSANARRCTPRELPLPCSMSSSVPVENALETSRDSRRPGNPELPQPVTTVPTTVGATTAASSAGALGSVVPPASPNPTTVHEHTLQRIVTAPRNEPPRQSFPVSEPYTPSRLPLSLTGQVSVPPTTATYPQPTFGTSPVGPASRVLPQKLTRRTKTHVASACVNCKKKHLGCDPARPCRRCVLSGKEDTCVDVTHKKRGRPPLKAEEASLRTYAAQVDNKSAVGDHGSQPRRTMHRASSSRELRPITDLQMHITQPGATGLGAAAGHPQRWASAVYPHAIDPSFSVQRNLGHRRFSSSGSVQPLAAASPPGYIPMPGGYNPALAAGRMPPSIGRPVPPHPSHGLHPAASPPHYHQPYGIPISPYQEDTRFANRLPIGETSVPRDSREGYAESPVRLPPIYPQPAAAPPGHRLSDPYPTTWSPRTREGFLQQQQQQQQQAQDTRQVAQQPGTMDPISPSNQIRQAAPDLGYMSQLGITSPTQGQSQQLPSSRAHDEQQGPETDIGDSRPAKRRKMALDDMVND